MRDKRMTEDEVVAEMSSGMTIGIGGWGSRRKPMSLVRAICRSNLENLTIVSFGGPDVGLLCASGKVARIVYGFVSLDSIPLEPHFRAARQAGAVEAVEYDEGMLRLALTAAAQRVSFLPTRAGLGSDIVRMNSGLRTVQSPYPDQEEFLAVPAAHLDVALVHQHRGDRFGNTQFLGTDLYFDDLFCLAANRAFASVEQVVQTEDFALNGPLSSLRLSRLVIDGIVEAPGGAHFTSCEPDYPRDERFQSRYVAAARDADDWERFVGRFLTGSERAYQAAVHELQDDQ